MISGNDSLSVRSQWKKPYLLICVEKPKAKWNPTSVQPPDLEWRRWFGFLEDAEKLILQTSDIERPTENTFLIPPGQVASVAAKVLGLAESASVLYQVFFLESVPQKCS
jgi:hypothetical protein